MIQLLLPLKTPPAFSFENLVVHRGIQAALAAILSAYGDEEPPFPSLFLFGPTGTGKTHLLKALLSRLATCAGESAKAVVFISPQGDPPRFPELERIISCASVTLAELAAVAVDDIHMLDDQGKTHLWTLANMLTRSGAPMLLAGRTSPEDLFHNNPHLRSRVNAGLVFRLEPPEDSDRFLIIDKMARDRNVRISADVARYLVTRKSRNISEIEKLLGILDTASLESGRRITLPFIRLLEDQGVL